ncbi:CTP synthase [Candidatus Azambacteria bacterium RIFCSPHIGHO2_02_FULL_52_12]|uniref:CTP synthase n=1 Tax=Candidatus Azambacteria bacterium RIFCSPLOWO2_01_FULL_46_25 TaxID=1797298 RepID=A0A1F5BV33_9BACT|nr:MAG: CTP synthase [Candidatus Azambacteria bacterium RIFCSPHIGHO2_02_FULL_52_12]OGD34441.1 MAG: CTP synthase [Candidatus Azambacteria bacterium RIFCSPLOWO2_01_FULL_46_25]OGD37281.1 MAG: CTP synthase [Candidatus Azambacteria bacterium RIFCSPHIGHO2_01_FULL_51_74]
MAKYIFITGGVCSGLGKGITGASIGMLLKASGYKVVIQKLDPYLNVDPGTMNPYQHGEVFVTYDGAETDLDLGHYERFIDEEFPALSSTSTGQIYKTVLDKEREGAYLGKTIQIIPHITNAIKDSIRACAKQSGADIMLVEIGGTVGDIEAEPYLEAARQLHNEEGHHNVMFIHLVLLPYLKSSGEVKTKPAQASVRELRRIGINADIIMCRYDDVIEQEHLEKIALFCDVAQDAVIPAPTVDSIYQVPLNFNAHHITKLIARHLNMDHREPDVAAWQAFVEKIHSDLPKVSIALVGKYNGLKDSYLSVMEAVKAAGYFNDVRAHLIWIDSEKIEQEDPATGKEWSELKKAKGIVVMGGFGKRGVEGKITVAKYARENNIPYLGLCLGMQIAAIEFARNVLGLADANSAEFDEATKNPVIYLMEEQKTIHKKGGTMRLGNYACALDKNSKSFAAYGTRDILERHRHRYEFNNAYKEQFAQKGMAVAGVNPESGLCEILENTNHPWFVGVQFHPEFLSRPLRPHPLFREFIKAAMG